MSFLTLSIVDNALSFILFSFQQQVDILEISRMAPLSTSTQTRHAISTMVYISFAQRFTNSGTLLQEKDPKPARIDNFGSGKVDREESADKGAINAVEKMRSLATERSKNSFRSGRFVVDSKQPSSPSRAPSLKQKDTQSSFFVSLGREEQQVDGMEENMRQAQNDRLALQNAARRQHQAELREREKNAAASLKLIRQKKPFTFDYEGASQGITPAHLPADSVRRIRQELRNAQVTKKDRFCQTTQVASTKMRAQMGRSLKGDAPAFSEKSFSVVQALGDDSHLAEGVKITEIRSSSNTISLQHRAKRPEGKPYRLTDYKNLSKGKSFREFPLASSRKNSLELSSSPADSTLKTVHKERPAQSRGKSEQVLKQQKGKAIEDALGRGLPFIRTKGLKFYDIGSASSFKTVDFSFNSSERRSQWRSSRIKVSDAALLQQVLFG